MSERLVILVLIMVLMLCRWIELNRLNYEFVFKNLGVKLVYGLKSRLVLLLIIWVLRCGIDMGGELIVVLL